MTTTTGSHASNVARTQMGGGNSPSITLDTSLKPTTDAAALDAENFGVNFIKRTPMWRHAKNKSMNTPNDPEALPPTNCSALERLRLSQTARPMDVFAHWKREGYLDLNPPYQRGDVWGMIRRRNLIRSIMLGIPIPSIIINDRFSANWGDKIPVIDGKQRITTILMFLEGELKVPSAWFGIEGDEITFPELPIARQRGMKNMPLPLCEGQLRNIEEEREVFELVNFGGVPQGESDSLPNANMEAPNA